MTARDDLTISHQLIDRIARLTYSPENHPRLVRAEARLLAAEQAVRNLNANLALRICRQREAIARELCGEAAP